MKTKVISMRLTEDEYERLDEIAINRRMTIADMVREIVRRGTPEKEVIDVLRQIKKAVQELRDMALDRGLRKNLYYAIRNGLAIEEVFKKLPGVSDQEFSEYLEAVDKKIKRKSGG